MESPKPCFFKASDTTLWSKGMVIEHNQTTATVQYYNPYTPDQTSTKIMKLEDVLFIPQ